MACADAMTAPSAATPPIDRPPATPPTTPTIPTPEPPAPVVSCQATTGGAALQATVDRAAADKGVYSVTLGVGPARAASAEGVVTVPVIVCHFGGASGIVQVTNGVPLPPGALRPGQERQVTLTIDGADQAINVVALPGRHTDGSLRAVLVQGRFRAGASGVLTLGGAERPASENAPAVEPAAVPEAALLPSDAAYLVSTELVGPTVTAQTAAALGGDFAKYERDFVRFEQEHWAKKADAWGENYYDRALIYFAFWVRTGNPDYWHRGTRLAYRYRTDYLEKNNHGSSPHWAQLEGLEKHYLLTGDERSRTAIGATADMLYRGFQRSRDLADLSKSENRIRTRVLQGELLAWRVDAPVGRDGVPWDVRMDEAVTKIIESQGPDGGFRFGSLCDQSINYMDGMLGDVLIEVHRTYRPDPRIRPAVQRMADFQWNTQWDPSARAFRYMSGVCPGKGGGDPAPDLNGLFVNTYAWLYAQTGDDGYRSRADQIFLSAVAETWLEGTKQFNQQYTTSYRYLGYRLRTP